MLLFIVLLFLIFISAALAVYLVKHDHGEKEPVGMLWLALGLGFAGSIAAAGLEYLVIPASITDPNSMPLASLFAASIGIGLIEEGCKFIPLALILFRKRFFNEHTDGIIYFALAGLGFGLPENLLYTFEFGAGAGVARSVMTPFFHAATTGMVGYFLVKRKLAHKSIWGIWPVLLLAIVVHGVYDFGLFSHVGSLVLLSIVIAFGVSTMLFLLFATATFHDQSQGLSAIGNNSFCRSCGTGNPKRHLYCSRCGKRA